MTKKILLTVIGLMLLALPLSCVISDVPLGTDLALGTADIVSNDKETDDILTSVEEEDLTMPDDFLDGFYIQYLILGSYIFDTKHNKMGVYTFGGYVSVDYHMPREKLQEIYDFIIQYDIKSYSSTDLITRDDGLKHTPDFEILIVFRLDGEVYSIRLEGSAILEDWRTPPEWMAMPEKHLNLRSFCNLLSQIFGDTDEYKSLPQGMLRI
ncbi:MAG: hypothetical protein FWE97_02880 [Dehalococcoidia bacterium]|jgi:hypothetical protein|nr:hypothetical protein [Dehalococcoidia bacterium]